jgi:hypothetical protein
VRVLPDVKGIVCQESPSARCTFTVENVTSTAFASLNGLSVILMLSVPEDGVDVPGEVPGLDPPPEPPPLVSPPAEVVPVVDGSGEAGPPPQANAAAATSVHAIGASLRVENALIFRISSSQGRGDVQQRAYRPVTCTDGDTYHFVAARQPAVEFPSRG